LNIKLAKRMSGLRASEVREILKITERPEIISFAGGLPAPELFPLEEIKRVSQLVLDEMGPKALQYSTTEGFPPLRQWVAERMNRRYGLKLEQDNILITSGSQQVLDLSGKLFLDEGDVVLCENPTYLAAITAFRAYGCEFREVETDDVGMIPEALEKALAETGRAKLIYVIPDFQNPTGRTWSRERREALAALAARFEVAIVEDNPYGELRFEGEFLPAVMSFDQHEGVIYGGTFSKIFCPGYRVGWVAGEKELVRKFVMAKQGTDIQCNTKAQMELMRYLELYDIEAHIERIRAVYRSRRDLALSVMAAEFPPSARFTRPEGGLFAWVELPEGLNARDVLVKSLEKNVAFVPGGAFFPNGGHENTLRINFSNMPEDRIVDGMKRLGAVLREMIGA
ncbi:PLP-dependent aminotransferase family protein, partial [Deltaproteobacteria bacterium OttesenSCG-928-M10]|nr:PLP-dependent aminotransferase family protein [Deltaproteobacteria bacterium OttesenSCG-928-M10]